MKDLKTATGKDFAKIFNRQIKDSEAIKKDTQEAIEIADGNPSKLEELLFNLERNRIYICFRVYNYVALNLFGLDKYLYLISNRIYGSNSYFFSQFKEELDIQLCNNEEQASQLLNDLGLSIEDAVKAIDVLQKNAEMEESREQYEQTEEYKEFKAQRDAFIAQLNSH